MSSLLENERIHLLLYADDCIILSESTDDLQDALNSLDLYCQENTLKINTDKTKIMVFSRGKVRKLPVLTLNSTPIDKVDKYTYLGVVFTYNAKFNASISERIDKGTKAMFSLLRKGREHDIPHDILLHLFDSSVAPVLMYGSEIWGCSNCDKIERIHLKFCKMILGLNNSTCNIMVYGELGRQPLVDMIKKRALNYWSHLLSDNYNKLAWHTYQLGYCLYSSGQLVSPWFTYISTLLHLSGMSFIWTLQAFPNVAWLKLSYSRILKDQFLQTWSADLHSSAKCTIYGIIKEDLSFERYLTVLPKNGLNS